MSARGNTAFELIDNGGSVSGGKMMVPMMLRLWTITHEEDGDMSRNGMRPVHPGEILRDELDALEMSAKALAAALAEDATES